MAVYPVRGGEGGARLGASLPRNPGGAQIPAAPRCALCVHVSWWVPAHGPIRNRTGYTPLFAVLCVNLIDPTTPHPAPRCGQLRV